MMMMAMIVIRETRLTNDKSNRNDRQDARSQVNYDCGRKGDQVSPQIIHRYPFWHRVQLISRRRGRKNPQTDTEIPMFVTVEIIIDDRDSDNDSLPRSVGH